MKKNTPVILFLLLLISGSCKNSKDTAEETKKNLEIKEKEVELKEREMALKEREKKLEDKSNNIAENGGSGSNNSAGLPGSYPQTTLIKLSDQDLQNKTDWELRIMRNEVYARYGYIFKVPELKDYFMEQSWYKPQYEDVTNMLSILEKENIEKIKSYETYIGSQYNKFSR